MEQLARDLLRHMKSEVDLWAPEEELTLEPRYGAAIAAVGVVPFMAELFQGMGDTKLLSWLIVLTFFWKDLPFTAWKHILYQLSDNAPAVYQFVTFVTEFLAIDIVRVIHEDPAVHETARNFAAARFPGGGASP